MLQLSDPPVLTAPALARVILQAEVEFEMSSKGEGEARHERVPMLRLWLQVSAR